MIKYICFIRGINVGGHKIIRMEDLNKMFVSLKFKDVTTYIQSGNVLFESDGSDQEVLRKQITTKMLKSLGYEVGIFLRTIKEIENIINDNPFKKAKENFKLYLTFLNEQPDEKLKEALESLSNKNEIFRVSNREVYNFIDKSIDRKEIKFSNNFIEKILKVPATTRDWNTINKIYSLMKS